MINRIEPILPAGGYQTFRIDVPDTHWRKATCEECGCAAYENGWVTAVDERTERGMAQAYYIRRQSGRSFTEERQKSGLTEFTFPRGQPCFSRGSHRIRIDRPEHFLRVGGDWRGNPYRVPTYRHANAMDWAENLMESIDDMERVRQRG